MPTLRRDTHGPKEHTPHSKTAETASRSCYETRLLTHLGLERVGYAVLSTEGRAGSDPGASFHEGRYGTMCLKLRFTRGAAAAAVFGT